MPVFEYQGVDRFGKKLKGTLDADSLRVARQKLKSQGIFTTDIRAGTKAESKATNSLNLSIGSRKIPNAKLAQETRQFATLVNAGIPIVEALQILGEQSSYTPLKKILIQVREQVEDGSSLAVAMGKFPRAFPRLYVNMITSGEASGTLDSVLVNLANHLEEQVELKRKLQSALTYPILILVICVLVIIGLVTFVVPKIVEIFEKEGAVLPLMTRILIAFSRSLTGFWFVYIGLILALILSAKMYYSSPKGRLVVDRLLLRLPLVSSLYQKVYTSRVSSTLSTLLASGVEMLMALEITKNTVGNVHVVKAIDDARDGVREGRNLSKELARSNLFPSLLTQMISVGERSGKLEEMLSKAGAAYKSDVSTSITGLTSLIGPIMIIGLGTFVLGIVISILMPMFSLMDKIQT
jgi:general secretion pathway protein F